MASEHCCKVDRVRAAYDISPPLRTGGGLDEYLVARWLGKNNNESTGLRTLAEWFNKQLLKKVYREHGRSDSSVRINSEYNALQKDEIPAHEREELISELADGGIDGEAIKENFISKSTLSRHLKNCLGATKQLSNSETEWELDRIRITTNTYRSHLESALQSLDNKKKITGIEDSELQIQAYLSCSECPTRVTVETAYEQGYVCSDHHDAS
jgi:hypothetical protein